MKIRDLKKNSDFLQKITAFSPKQNGQNGQL